MENKSIPPFREGLNFVAIDTETTGLNFNVNEIIELSAIRFEAGREKERFSTLVRPRGDMPKFIQFLTHIKPEDLKNAPDARSALRDFLAFVGNDVVVGHNVGFDLGFINHHSALQGGDILTGKSWDTVDISRVYLPYATDHKLSTLVKDFGITLENAHRAGADALATGQLLVLMGDYILDHFPLLVNARLLDLSKQAQLDDTLYDFLYRIVEYQRRYVLIGKKPHIPDLARPNVLEHKANTTARISIDEVFSQDGVLSKHFPNFEFRSGQLEMAREVDTCFKNEKHLAVEAGTGVGKSFAYLVPAISFANRHNTKVVVSTNTKNLQDQLFYKDLPQLKTMLPLPFKAVLVKGRENYVCERRWEEFLMEQSRGITPWEAQALLYLFIWKYQTKSGDISENSSFDRSRFSLTWQKVCSDRYTCRGKKCPHASKCYVMSLRKHIEDSSVVVTNHSLLLADLRMDNSTLGEYSYLVVDEAHNLMMTASKILGFELGYLNTINLLNQLDSSQKRKKTGFLHLLEQTLAKSAAPKSAVEHASHLSKNLAEKIKDLRKILLDLFTEAAKLCAEANSYSKLRIKDTEDFPGLYKMVGNLVTAWKNFIKDLQALSNLFNSLNSKQIPSYDALGENLNSYLMRALETEFNILCVENPDLNNYALWIESYRPDSKVPTSLLCYAPVDVSDHLQKALYTVVPSIVFTSATLALRGSFKYFFGQSGLSLVPEDKIKAIIVDSPFDFNSQSRLMVGSFLPEHKDKFFANQALGCLEQLVTSTNVGTMILFTSYRDLNNVYDHLGETLYHSKRPFFAQGKGANRSTILEEFKSHKNAVLLGTNSFWEGVDIQGESLSLLILFKLPFQVPSDPIVEAYIDKLERENKDSFMHYMLPNALLRLRQGFGRLIRSKTDRGVVLIMDSRVSRKRYGEYFKKVLPTRSLELTSELELLNEVTHFLNLSPGGNPGKTL